MGCGQSAGRTDLYLAGSGLTFTRRQLRRLNDRFAWMEHRCNAELNKYYSYMNPQGSGPGLQQLDAVGTVEAAVERLVQRIIATVGTRDPRFASCFLLSVGSSYEHYKVNKPDEFDYMVRLDSLSWPPLYPSDAAKPPCSLLEDSFSPQGFGRLRLDDQHRRIWAEFVDDNGLLLRDRLKERFVTLVRQAVAEPIADMRDVQEASLCGCSGKIVDIGVLDYILLLPPEQRFFLAIGNPSSDKFPDPRQLDITVSCDGPSVTLEVKFPPAGGDGRLPARVSIDLTLAVGLAGWPATADFPDRVPLSHIDALLFHRTTAKGFHMVPTEPHPSVPCTGRSTIWRVSMSAAEMELSTHYSHDSAPAAVLRVLKIISSQLSRPSTLINQHLPPTHIKELLQSVSTYMLKTLFFFELETDSDMSSWCLDSVSLHVLRILDALMQALRYKNLRSYFFPSHNVVLRKECGPADYAMDAAILERFLRELHRATRCNTPVKQVSEQCWLRSHRRRVQQDQRLISVWLRLLEKQRQQQPAGQFSEQQLCYLDELLQAVERSAGRSESEADTESKIQPGVLAALFLSARHLFPAGCVGRALPQACRSLPEAVRLAAATAAGSPTSSVAPATAAEPAGRTLVRALRVLGFQTESEPTVHRLLERLYTVSALNGALLEEDISRRDSVPLAQMALFAATVCSQMGSVAPELELRAAGCQLWAQQLLQLSTQLGGVRLVFTPERGRTISCLLRSGTQSPPPVRPRADIEKELEFLLQEAELEDCSIPPPRTVHCMLQYANTIRSYVDNRRRYGRQRGIGHITQAIIHMGRSDLLEKLAAGLPAHEREHVLAQLRRCPSASRTAPCAVSAASKGQTTADGSCSAVNVTGMKDTLTGIPWLQSGRERSPSTAGDGWRGRRAAAGAVTPSPSLRGALPVSNGQLNPVFSDDEQECARPWSAGQSSGAAEEVQSVRL